jgi:heme/copper-type cytochrome/quinol oxidase subunit 2
MGKKFIEDARTLALGMLVFGLSPITVAAEDPATGDAEQQWIEIRIEKRTVVGDDVIRVTEDQSVALRWTTDEAAELHIHGYDIRFEISPDAPAEVEFMAHATGRYAVTSHGFGGEHSDGHDNLLYIEVHPN